MKWSRMNVVSKEFVSIVCTPLQTVFSVHVFETWGYVYLTRRGHLLHVNLCISCCIKTAEVVQGCSCKVHTDISLYHEDSTDKNFSQLFLYPARFPQ